MKVKHSEKRMARVKLGEMTTDKISISLIKTAFVVRWNSSERFHRNEKP